VGEICDKHIPLFGVCLGHQAIGEHFGAKLCQLPLPEHGKAASITHTGSPILHGVKSPFEGGRYHSLYLDKKTIPDCLEVLAETTDHSLNERTLVVPMAIKHHTLPVVGLQFHPESLMTLKKSAGKQLLHNIVYLLTGNR
jgi:anthranilate synthase/aminodeoxychorismate synthase-like glutamine amidotransferase